MLHWLRKLIRKTKTEKQSDTEATQQSAAEQENSLNYSKLIQSEPVKNTPFTLITNNHIQSKENVCIVIGTSRVTDYMTYNQAMHQIQTKSWELIYKTGVFAAERVKDYYEKQQQN